jgi:DNA-binding NtrC family response regulator
MPLYPANSILIIDDNAVSLRSLTLAMRSHGINHVVECQDSRDVEVLLAQGRYDLVLLDLTMPEVSGEEILSLTGEHHPELPVIVVTGVEDVETAVHCLNLPGQRSDGRG